MANNFDTELQKYREREAAGLIRDYQPKNEIDVVADDEMAEERVQSGTLWKLSVEDVTEPTTKKSPKSKNDAFVWPKTLEINPKKMKRLAGLVEGSFAMQDRWRGKAALHSDDVDTSKLEPAVKRLIAMEYERGYQNGVSATLAAIYDDDRDEKTARKFFDWIRSLSKRK